MKLSMQGILCVAALLAGSSVANAAIVTVGPSGTHATLAAAITAANDGDTIRFVDAGSYAGATLPAGKTLFIDRDTSLTTGSVVLNSPVNAGATTGGVPVNTTITGIDINRSTAGSAMTIDQGTGAVTITLNYVNVTSTGADVIRFDGGVGGAPVTFTMNGGSVSSPDAGSGTRSCFRMNNTQPGGDSLAAAALQSSTISLNGTTVTGNYNAFRFSGYANSTLNLNGATLINPTAVDVASAIAVRVEGATNSAFNITDSVITSHDAGILESTGTNNVFNVTGTKISTNRANGVASAIRSNSGASGSTFNIQRCSLTASASARVLNFGAGGLPTVAPNINIYNTVITGADTQMGVNVNGCDLRMWNCTVAGFGGTPTAAAVRVETGGGTGRTLDVRNSLLTGYASMVNPDAADNSLTDYNFISAADSDAGPNRVTNTSETLTFNSTNIMDASHFVPNVPSIGGTPMGTASAALVTGNLALLGTDRFGGTRPVPALSNPDMGAVETSFGGPPPTPEMEVFDGVTLLSNGATIDLGNVLEGSPTVTRTITVNNVGDATLTITDTQIGGTGYSIDAPLAGTLAALTGTDSVVVQVSTAVVGPTNGTLNIVSDDPTNSNFLINFVLDVDPASREANWMNHD